MSNLENEILIKIGEGTIITAAVFIGGFGALKIDELQRRHNEAVIRRKCREMESSPTNDSEARSRREPE